MAATVRVEVPVRVCDVGGWTDTWFAERGRVCNLAVEPGVSVSARSVPGPGEVRITALDFAASFVVGAEPPEHRLLAEAVREAGRDLGQDPARTVELRISAAVPPGASLGTSAASCVGVIAAMDALRGDIRGADELAAAAHRVEVERLGRQSGVQDQVAAAHGGAILVDIDPYPRATARRIALPAGLAAELDERLLHVAYGRHDSSAVHGEVIAALADEGPRSPRLGRLRALADEAGRALVNDDLERYGQVLSEATEAQAALHADLVGPVARQLIELARSAGALGWKVNGAGGAGGSISILCRHASDRARLGADARRRGHAPLALVLAGRGARIVDRPGSGTVPDGGDLHQ